MQWARGTQPGDPTRLGARQNQALFRVLLVLVAGAGGIAAVVPVENTVSGDAVIDHTGRYTAVLPDVGALQEGDRGTLHVPERDPEQVTVESVRLRPEGVVVGGEATAWPGEPRGGRLEVRLGSSSLLRTLLSGIVLGEQG